MAANYVTSAVHARGRDLDRIAEEAARLRPTLAIDVGTATAHTALAMVPHARLVVGLDLTAAMLEQAARRVAESDAPNARLVRGDVERLPFLSARADLLTSRLSAHHYPHPAEFAREAARVLRPGGHLLLSDTVAPPEPALDAWIDRVERLRDPSHVRDHAVTKWHAYFAAAGLQPDTLIEWHLTLDFDDWVARMRTPRQAVMSLRELMLDADASTRNAFDIRTPNDQAWSFVLHAALIRAVKPV